MAILSRFLLTSQQFRRYFTPRVTNLMTTAEVNAILREGELSKSFNFSPVKGFDCNHLASNTPTEDFHQEAKCTKSPGFLFGIFDGHGGPFNSHVVSDRLFEYAAAALMPDPLLYTYMSNGKKDDLLQYYSPKKSGLEPYQDLYTESFRKYLKRLSTWRTQTKCECVFGALEYAFLNLDRDISREALHCPKIIVSKPDQVKHNRLLSVALNGCVACVAHIAGKTLHLASLGDSSAVIGTLADNNTFESRKLIYEHICDNEQEVMRVKAEHPPSEGDTIFQSGRLFGNLAPLRAFGDFRYKWRQDIIEDRYAKAGRRVPIVRNYFTPPYVSSRPDIVQYDLTPKDKFLIIASDGLWDVMTPMQAVNIVGKHMIDRPFFSPIPIPKNMTMGHAKEVFKENMETVKSKPDDLNAATYLLRNAIGGLERGEMQEKYLKLMLSIPAKDSRSFRDDISITVIYFNPEYIDMFN